MDIKELEKTIYYEDNHVMVIDKPAGILSQSDITGDKDILSIYKEYLSIKYNKPGKAYLGLVQRLDKNVSGILVLSKSTKAHTRLNESRPKKKYLAVVEGKLDNKKGTLINRLSKNENTRTAYQDNINGKEAILNFEVINELDNLSLLDIEIETGRFHQIRCQLSLINHPIYNDKKYGSNYLESDNFNLGLDCYQVSFIHPTTKENITIKRLPKRDKFLQFESIKL